MSTRKKKVMIGCPTDAERFMDEIKEGIGQFNDEHGEEFKVSFEFKHWKSDTYSEGDNPQKAINKQLCDKCDLLIAVFYQSLGSALATTETGTVSEIDYFKRQKKPVFILMYDGDVTLNCDKNKDEYVELRKYINENKDKIYYVPYNNNISEVVKEQLLRYYSSTPKKRTKNASASHNTRQSGKSENWIQKEMRTHIMQCDKWNGLSERFKFSSKAESLIKGMKDDGSIQYYLSQPERYRTTPVASVLIALYISDLIPEHVCYKIQDWIYMSKNNPGDKPSAEEGNVIGHEPYEEDLPGWSKNEGVSVWTTSKALEALITTGYFERKDVKENEAIHDEIRKALLWLAEQAYESGGWGFQKVNKSSEEYEACKESVTMTALTLKVISQFCSAIDNQFCISFNDAQINKLSNAKKSGIQYLYQQMNKDETKGWCYWNYEDKPSLTATVWVLDYINVDSNQAGDLYQYRRNIRDYCLSRMPKKDDDFDDFKQEVYFTGGKTKYKPIKQYNKFYSYMPYHIHSLLDYDVSYDSSEVLICIRKLITGRKQYWNGQDRSTGEYQRPTCFVTAMALSVIARWVKMVSSEALIDILDKNYNKR